jgi:hypothetical protein
LACEQEFTPTNAMVLFDYVPIWVKGAKRHVLSKNLPPTNAMFVPWPSLSKLYVMALA